MHYLIVKYQTIVPNNNRTKLRNTTIANKIQEWAASPSVDCAVMIGCLGKRSTSTSLFRPAIFCTDLHCCCLQNNLSICSIPGTIASNRDSPPQATFSTHTCTNTLIILLSKDFMKALQQHMMSAHSPIDQCFASSHSNTGSCLMCLVQAPYLHQLGEVKLAIRHLSKTQ
jgi:hypothetical protein